MARFTCNHCFREFETGPQNQAAMLLCQGCAELGHTDTSRPGSPACIACRADETPRVTSSRGGKKRPGAEKSKLAETKTVASPSATVSISVEKQKLLSTLAGLASIAHTPHGQKVAEDLLLAYVNDPAIAEAYRPFARET